MYSSPSGSTRKNGPRPNRSFPGSGLRRSTLTQLSHGRRATRQRRVPSARRGRRSAAFRDASRIPLIPNAMGRSVGETSRGTYCLAGPGPSRKRGRDAGEHSQPRRQNRGSAGLSVDSCCQTDRRSGLFYTPFEAPLRAIPPHRRRVPPQMILPNQPAVPCRSHRKARPARLHYGHRRLTCQLQKPCCESILPMLEAQSTAVARLMDRRQSGLTSPRL